MFSQKVPTLLMQILLISATFAEDPDAGLNSVQLIENHGYPCESHSITTEDGYILTYHRIPHGKNDNSTTNKPPVLLMHGLVSSSADYVNMGPDRSLGFILADMGYDVWLGNARGNAWSRNHTTLDVVVDAANFFNFSWHEIGYYDLPAAIDYILDINGAEGLYYIGHSQGCTSFLVLTSTKPEYNNKIKLASLMGPAGFMEHQNKTLLKVLGQHIYDIEKMLIKYKIYELPLVEELRSFIKNFCTNSENVKICLEVLELIDGADPDQLDNDKIPVLSTNAPSNAAAKQFIHYGQQIKNGGFAQYDYGSEKNKEIYGSETPPLYDLSKITAPVAVYYGENDGLVNYEDAATVISKLPNVANDFKVPMEKFNHIDFLFAKDVMNLLYVELIKVMQKF